MIKRSKSTTFKTSYYLSSDYLEKDFFLLINGLIDPTESFSFSGVFVSYEIFNSHLVNTEAVCIKELGKATKSILPQCNIESNFHRINLASVNFL